MYEVVCRGPRLPFTGDAGTWEPSNGGESQGRLHCTPSLQALHCFSNDHASVGKDALVVIIFALVSRRQIARYFRPKSLLVWLPSPARALFTR